MRKFLSILMVIVSLVVLASCEGVLPGETHTHDFSGEYKFDDTYHWHICECGEKETTEAHIWNDGEITIAPTEDAVGEKTYTCTVCGQTKKEEVAKLTHEHTWVEATCTAPKTCSTCNATEGDALGHKESEAVVENHILPVCILNGSYDSVVYCSVCDVELSRETVVVEALGHTYETEVTVPTCTTKGYTTYTCHCGYSYVDDEVPALGHTEVIDAAVAETCTEAGKNRRKTL